MQIKVNEHEETEHFRAICEDCYNISRTCGYDRLTMSHIHNTSEILFCGIRGGGLLHSRKEISTAERYDILVIEGYGIPQKRDHGSTVSEIWAYDKTCISKRDDTG